MNSRFFLATALALSVIGAGLVGIALNDNEADGAPTPTATVGIEYSSAITFADSPALVNVAKDTWWSMNNGNPDGFYLTMNSSLPWMNVTFTQGATIQQSTVNLSGIPTTAGTFTVSVAIGFEDDAGYVQEYESYNYALTVANPTPLEFANPPAINMVSGQTLSYTPATNIPATITLVSGAPSWFVFQNGILTVTAPDVSEKTTFTATLKATAGSQTATQTVTVTVTPELVVDSSFPVGEFVAGGLYSYSPGANITSGVTWTLKNAPSWLAWDQETQSVKGTVPSGISASSQITYTLTATTAGPNQSASQVVTASIVPVLSFASMPTADMIVTPVENMPRTFAFTLTGDNVDSVLWDFGDGNTSDEWSPVHTYDTEGEYEARVTVSNALGTDSFSSTIDVATEDIGDFWQTHHVYIIGLILGLLVLMFVGSKIVKKSKRRA